MDLPNDPRAAGFNSAEVRDALKFAMKMGLPDAVEERITFMWRKQRDYQSKDPAGRPYNWRSQPTSDDTPDPVQIDAAIQFSDRMTNSSGTALGQFDAARIQVTVLDVDYELVRGANIIMANGATYTIDFVAPPEGLFDMTVYTIYASSVDEH